jgi:hypothetical protein
MKVRRVLQHGQFFWNYNAVFLGKTLAGERIGLLPVDDRYLRIYIASYAIARFDTIPSPSRSCETKTTAISKKVARQHPD